MTQEEKELLLKDLCARLPYGVICTDLRHGDSKITEVDTEDGLVYCYDARWLINWLNSHHFDFRGLIEKSLAIVAPEEMYKNE